MSFTPGAPEPERRPLAVLVATLTVPALALQYVVCDAIGWQLARNYIVGDGFLSAAFLWAVRPFYGGLFGPHRTLDTLLPWMLGFVIAAAIVWVTVLVVSRKGSLAAFVGTWFATMAGGCVGTLCSAYLWALLNELPAGRARTQTLAIALDHGLHWGFVYGWAPALFAALLAGVLRQRVQPVAPAPPLAGSLSKS